jgi:hypothetical protein
MQKQAERIAGVMLARKFAKANFPGGEDQVLRAYAKANDRTLSYVIREALREYAEKIQAEAKDA